jgi:small subunit ribosomal protein S19
MSRSSKKGYYVNASLASKVRKALAVSSRKPIKTYARQAMITPEFLDLTFEVHNGKMFHLVHITSNMIGHRLGEFSPTRTFKGHSVPTQKVQK